MDIETKIIFLLAFSAVIQFCSLCVLGLMAGDLAAFLKAHMIVHYEEIAKWKYGGNRVAESAGTTRRPVAVSPLS